MPNSVENITRTRANSGQLYTGATYATIALKDQTYDILISTGPDEIEIRGSYESYTGGSTVDLYALPTVSDNGTEVLAACNCVNTDKKPRTKIYHTPTVTDVGEKILAFNLSAANKVRSTVSPDSVRRLRSSSLYLIRFTAVDAGAEVQAFLEWTEV